jgi:tetratricopeptide (TPR) repeat protein
MERNADRYNLKDIYWLAAITLFALAVRLIYFLQIRNSPFFNHLFLDMALYDRLAGEILEGPWYGRRVPMVSPLYPYILSGFYLASAKSIAFVRFFQLMLGVVNCILVYFCGRKLFNNRIIAGIAGLLMTGYGPLIFYESELLLPVWVIFFQLVILLLLSNVKSWRGWLLIGLASGFLTLLRPNNLILLAIIGLFILWKERARGFPKLFTNALVFGTAFVIILLPNTMRNFLVFKDPALIMTSGGIVFYLSNNEDSQGNFMHLPGMKSDPEILQNQARDMAGAELGREITMRESSSHWTGKTFKFIFNHPVKFAALEFRKLLLIINTREISNNYNYYFNRGYGPVLYFTSIPWGFIFFTGSLGLILAFYKRERLWPVWLLLANAILFMMIFYVSTRFRMALLPFLCLGSGYLLGGWSLYRDIKSIRFKPLLILFILILGLICFWPRPRPGYFQSYVSLGDVLIKTRDYKVAEEALEKALELKEEADVLNNLGVVSGNLGKMTESEGYFIRALKIDPDHLNTRLNLGNHYLKISDYPLAVPQLKRAVSLKSNEFKALNNLGFAFMQTGEVFEAKKYLIRAVEINPEYSSAYFNLGIACGMLKEYESGAVYLGKAVALTPDNSEVYFQLGLTLGHLGNFKDACNALEKAVDLNPESSIFRETLEKMREYLLRTGQ